MQGVNTIRGLELLPNNERWRDLGLFNLMNINKSLKGVCQDDGARLFLVVPIKQEATGRNWRTESSNEHEEELYWVSMNWNTLSGEFAKYPSLKICKYSMDAILCHGMILLEKGGWTMWTPRPKGLWSRPTLTNLGFWDFVWPHLKSTVASLKPCQDHRMNLPQDE